MARTDPSKQRDQFVAFAFAAAELLLEVDQDGRIVFAVGMGKRLVGDDADALVGRQLEDLFAPRDFRVIELALEELGKGERLTTRLATLDPTGVVARLNAFKAPFLESEAQLALGAADGLERSTERYDCDPTSGVLNRRSFEHLVNTYLGQSHHTGKTYGLSLVKLDGLAALEKELDEERRQRLMADIGAGLRLASGERDLAGRLGAETFAVLQESADEVDVEGLIQKAIAGGPGADRLRAERTDIDLDDSLLSEQEMGQAMAYAMGRFASNPDNFGDARNLNAALKASLHKTVEDLGRVKEMIAHSRFAVVYQPIVALENDSIHHYEALSRFPNGQSPYELVTFAEEVGVITDFDLAVVRKVLGFLGTLPPNRSQPFIAVNVSARSLETDQFITDLRRYLSSSGRRARQLMFEITESTQIRNLERADNIIQSLRKDGFKVCLDDFGAGAAAFHYIRNLGVDHVKLDGDYVRRFIHNRRDASIIRAMTSLCADLGVSTIAEMIETEEQVEALRALGVNYGQGWHYGKPAPKLVER